MKKMRDLCFNEMWPGDPDLFADHGPGHVVYVWPALVLQAEDHVLAAAGLLEDPGLRLLQSGRVTDVLQRWKSLRKTHINTVRLISSYILSFIYILKYLYI